MGELPLRIIRSRRRTYSIEINESGIVLRIPHWMGNEGVEEILRRHEGWIEKHAGRMLKRKREKESFGLEGGNLMYLGKPYPIERIGTITGVRFDGRAFRIPDMDMDTLRRLLLRWFREEARRIITPRVLHYSKITGLQFNSIRITSAMSRWGSCSAKNNLNFSYRIVMAPPHVIDYVVVHELVHTEIRGHGRDFWNRVSKIMPDYRERDRWLREYGHLLFL